MTNWKRLYNQRNGLYKEIKALQEEADTYEMSFNQYRSNYDKIQKLRVKYNIINAMLQQHNKEVENEKRNKENFIKRKSLY